VLTALIAQRRNFCRTADTEYTITSRSPHRVCELTLDAMIGLQRAIRPFLNQLLSVLEERPAAARSLTRREVHPRPRN
jgi:hypothetical protein